MPYSWQTTKTDWVATDAWSTTAANRIDNNTRYLVEQFQQLGITVTLGAIATVVRTDWLRDALLNLLESNLNAVKDAWIQPTGWATLAEDWNTSPLSYVEANEWENNLQLIKDKFDIFIVTVLRTGMPLAITGRRIGGI